MDLAYHLRRRTRRADPQPRGLAGRGHARDAGPHRAQPAGAERVHHHRRRCRDGGGARGRGGGDARRAARAAAWRAGRGEGPDPDRRSSHHLGLADLQGPRARARRGRGGATEAGGRHRGRQDDDAGIRPAMPDPGAAVRPHAQRLARGSQFRRFERRLGGRGCRGTRADRGRHRWRRIDAHSRPRATASSASSRGSAWCRRNTRRTGSATSPTSRR